MESRRKSTNYWKGWRTLKIIMIYSIREKLDSEKNIDKILTFLICGTLLVTNILIGSPTDYNTVMINIIVTLVAMIFIILKKISKRERILENKLDICVLILCMSSCISLIFNSYTTLTGCLNYILKYISVFLIYIVVKGLTKENPNFRTYITNIIIISAILFVILGIDKMSTNIFLPLARAINLPEITYEETRMDSFFSYANAFAAFCSMALFLAIGGYIKVQKKIKKCIYGIAIFLLETGIILSYSRTIFIFLTIVFLIYLILLKNKEEKIKALEYTIISGIFSVIYTTIYMKLLSSGSFIMLWLLLLIFSVLASITTIASEKINNRLVKIKMQHMIFLVVVIFIIILVFFITGLQQTKPLIMFNTRNSEKKITNEIYQVKGNTNYTFTFDVEAKSTYTNTSIFKIAILEKNKYFDDIKQTEIEFGTYSGEKEISITSTENTTEIFIIFSSKISKEDIYLKVNKLFINNQEEVLNYKYLPTSLVNKIKNIKFNTKSAWERGVFIMDALKLVKNNFLLGIGGDGWQYREGEVQSYYYWAREVHSYPIQVLLEFGIVGFLTLVGIVILVIKYSYTYLKEKKDVEFVTILCSILIVFLHSFLDFDMSFMCIMIMVFALLGMLSGISITNNKMVKTKNVINIATFIGLILIVGINISNQFIYTKIVEVQNENNVDVAYEKLQDINQHQTYLLPVKEQNIYIAQMYSEAHNTNINTEIIKDLEFMLKYEKYNNTLENCKQLVEEYSKINNMSEEEYVEKVEKICNIAKATNISELYNISENLKRQEVYLAIAEILNKQYEKWKNETLIKLSNEVCQIVIDEYANTCARISDYEKCRITKENSEEIIEILEQNYENAKSMVK